MNPWSLTYDDFDPEREPLREALCTLGNGYFATRGAVTESQASDVHYPGTYLAGGFNRLDTVMAGRTITNEDLVNLPNWLFLTFRHEDDDWFNLLRVEILSYTQRLDMRRGVLERRVRVKDRQGRLSTIASRRLVHMRDPHCAGLEYAITAENWSGPVTVRSALDGSVINAGVARYRELNSRHLASLDLGEVGPDGIYLLTRTTQSQLAVAQAARTTVYVDDDLVSTGRQLYREESIVGQDISFGVTEGQTAVVEKLVTLHSSRDLAVSEPAQATRTSIVGLGRFADLLDSHTLAWAQLWRKCDVEMDAAGDEQTSVRAHIFHLLQTVSPNTVGLDVGVPARGLHGEAYRGHIFWDELFICPFYTYRIPEITRSLLLYRYRRLNAARQAAREAGYAGAMFPWQSGSDGREETQVVHLNPRSGTWGPDRSRLQRHVNSAIVYNIWQYVQMTGDRAFLSTYGAETILEIARFWSSVTTLNGTTGRYEIAGVMGPDEYHEQLPDTDEPGLRNNAYTNVMAVWVFERAIEALELLDSPRRQELVEQLRLESTEVERWLDITSKMTVPFHDDGIISQFEGYEDLAEFDWGGYAERYGNIARLDRVLKAEGDTPDRYKVSKQADVLMLFYLLPPKVLRHIFRHLGYAFDDELVRRNIEYYMRRTSHGSTLSQVVHAAVLDRVDRTAAWSLFSEALQSDLSDSQGGTTPEGIHLGAMAGTVDIVMRHYAGIDTSNDTIGFYPRLPGALSRLRLRLRYRQHWFDLTVNHDNFVLEVAEDGPAPVTVIVGGQLHELRSGTSYSFPLDGGGKE